MELRRYIEIVRHRWWVVVGAMAVTSLVTAFFVVRQPWVYESSGTFVVRPRAVESDEVVRAIDTLNRGVEINSTYARIAESDLMKQRARARLGGEIGRGIGVHADVVAGTNLLEIRVTGRDPAAVQEMAEAVGAETVAYVAELNDVFGLVALDPPDVPSRPAGPNKPLTIALGIVFGVFLGVGLAVLGEYVGTPVEVRRRFDIIDPVTETYNEEFFKLRFRQEVSRTKRGRQSFSLGILKLATRPSPDGLGGEPPPADDLKHVARVLEPDLREEDVLGYLGEGTFAVMLPDLPVDQAEVILMGWQATIGRIEEGERRPISELKVSIGVCEYGDEGLVGDRESEELARVL